jgi:hypothetical protein
MPLAHPLGPDGGDELAGGEVGLGHAKKQGGSLIRPTSYRLAAVDWPVGSPASSGGAPTGNLTAVRGWPRLNHVLRRKLPCNPRKVPGTSQSLEKWRRSELDGGGRGGSGSGEGVAQRDQHMARGGVVVHREGLRLTGARGNRAEHNAHRAAAMADGGGSGRQACARGTAGTGLYARGKVGWGR